MTIDQLTTLSHFIDSMEDEGTNTIEIEGMDPLGSDLMITIHTDEGSIYWRIQESGYPFHTNTILR